jgi:indolepyruvate ferredoxin oxidoreductase beta subunit
MTFDLILAGVGGQGVLSVAAVIALGAMKDSLSVRQSEVHGMAQRGGAVQAHLRLADHPIASDLIGRGKADLVLSTEPLESLRYVAYLKPEGALVSSADPVRNIAAYPELESLYASIRSLPRHSLIAAEELARQAGSVRASNLVMVGAAAPFLPVRTESLLAAVQELFGRKGEKVVLVNCRALEAGLAAVQGGQASR